MTRPFYRKWLVLLLAGTISTPPSCWLYQQEQGNFHEVSKGQVYRSRQLSGEELAHYIDRYKIKSILNLRGENRGSRWYQEERQTSSLLGLRHYDYGISANHEVDDQTLDRILSILRDAPKPILIHCKFGADRTALIAAVYLYAIERKSSKHADQQLSLLYGHFPYLWSRSGAMDRSFWRYAKSHPVPSHDVTAAGVR